ncbi:HD-GYP domain-containing protein [Planctomyces sp. SH-PL14]|uniref:HD-GYP domain-containing protein n=1 Tax=Planctomyces sp. SH-PL14 TaxID=1632864 RepID=UPI00078C5904|nr:HD domain-containing phosphohydrolase [Planctomyces sp. SH-PL14]AMV22534.1 Cyclic di-GMP phosphodiesterase response regulator RpfG [Planctomyces sp. SH-PL14]
MPQRVRFILILACLQAGCLLGGLLMYERFLLAVLVPATRKAAAAQHVPSTHPAPPASAHPVHSAPAAPHASVGQMTPEGETLLMRLFTFIWVGGLQTAVAWLLLSRLYNAQAIERNSSQEAALSQSRELLRTRDAVIFGLAKLAESRDPETGHHLERISMYATRLAGACRRHPRFKDLVSPSFVQTIGISSALHDIGKVGIEDAILLKPGRLTEAEYERMQVHPRIGGECIEQIQSRLGESGFLRMARDIALYHHEWWDGTGYPHGQKEDEIPLAARIVAIADVYDALSSKRIYKDAYPHAVCAEKIARAAGSQFDPLLVEVFLGIQGQFQEIAELLRSEETGDVASPRRIAAYRREEADGPGLSPDQERILVGLMAQNRPPREAVGT